jgi:hypothetical protein
MKRRSIYSTVVVICWAALSPPVALAQTTRNYEGVDAIVFQRSADDVLQNIRAAPGKTLSPVEQFRADFFGGDWGAIATSLKQMPPAVSARVYDKMLGDLVSKGEPFMLLDDVLGLAKANPGDWTAGRLRQLGLLVKACVPPMQRRWLEQQLKEGLAGLGGEDPTARLAAGRMLIHAQFSEMATRFLPKPEESRAIQDTVARDEVLAFYSLKLETEQVEEKRQPPAMAQQLEVLKDPAAPPQKARQTMALVVRQVDLLSPTAISSAVGMLIRENPPAAQELLVETLKHYRLAIKGSRVDARLNNLYAIQALAATVAAAKDDEQSWKQLLQLMVDHWTQEADNTFAQRGARIAGRPDAVDAQEVVATAPAGAWLAALPAPMAERIDTAIARCVITAGDFDRAATLIVELSKRNADAALAVADDFLVAWGERNSPDLPEPLRRKYGLPDDAHIAVTPVMMANNIRNLARIMALFREAGVAWKDNARIVAAFDAAYGNAEAYHLSHIEQVFGSVAQMSEGLVLQMMTRMRDSLGGRWRKIEVQQADMTRRNESETLQMVRDGYTAALQIADAWLADHRDGYRVWALAGTLLNDWADFEYFQQLVTTEGPARMTVFKEKQGLAQQHFTAAAEAYAGVVPALAPADYTIDPYVAWFNSLLGVNSNGDINLSKPMNRAALERIRGAIRALPGKAAEAHVNLFARYVSGRMQSTTSPLHEDLKYKFLASSLIITQDNPFTLQTRKQVEYYDQLLSEIRLRTSIDGPTTVGRDQDFGVVLSVVHTESMGRMAKFGQYLTNAQPSEAAARRTRDARNPLMPHPLRMTEVQGPRDQLELSIREALEPFFDIRSITFSRADVTPRKTDPPGWQETVLAYIHLRAKDASVDRVPPVEMDLSFLDLSGPVTIPARSAETLLKVSSARTPPRPAEKIEVVQTLDPRQFAASGGLTLRVTATAVGLVPEFEDILDLGPVQTAAEVRSVAARGGALVKELHSWGEKVTAVSEREWTVVLDGSHARDAGQTVAFEFPTARRPDVTVSRMTYDDMNLVSVKASSVAIGRAGAGAVAPPRRDWVWMTSGAAALAVALPVGLLILRRSRHRQAPGARARDLFKVPAKIDGFVVVRLLRRLVSSPLAGFEPAERAAIQQDIERVEQAVFVPGAAGLSDGELRDIAGKWIARLD